MAAYELQSVDLTLEEKKNRFAQYIGVRLVDEKNRFARYIGVRLVDRNKILHWWRVNSNLLISLSVLFFFFQAAERGWMLSNNRFGFADYAERILRGMLEGVCFAAVGILLAHAKWNVVGHDDV